MTSLPEPAAPSTQRGDVPSWMSDRRFAGALYIAVLAATIAVFFRLQIMNGFTVLFSDRNDGVLEDVILEHWFNVVRGLSAWTEVNYFYPHPNTLGYTDAYFLYGLAHALFRGAGLDPFLSSEMVNVVVKAIGFVAFFVACRRIFDLSFGWALFGASLFTLSHSSYVQAGHAQLFSISFAPLLAVLLWESHRALLASQQRRLILYGCGAGLCYGAWLLTAYYMAWFFAFFGVALVAMLLAMSGKPALARLWAAGRDNLAPLLVVAVVTTAALVPFLMVYLPKAEETGMRSFEGLLHWTLGLKDLVNVGASNLLYGRAYTASIKALCPSCDMSFGEQTTGIAPLLLILLGCCCAWLLRAADASKRQLLLGALALATVITWALCIHLRNLTGWYLVYHLFPGAKALRVVSRYQIFLMAPIVALVVCYLEALAQRVPKPLILGLCALLLLGEIDTGTSGTVSLPREAEIERTAAAAPPSACRSFFTTAARDQDSSTLVNAVYPHNVDAMMIAELVNLPTINGFSSFNPSDWDFAYPSNPDYLGRIEKYASLHQLTGLCRLDLATLQWQPNWRAP